MNHAYSYWDREKAQLVEESTARAHRVRWLYEHPVGKIANKALSRRLASRIYGLAANYRWSSRWIEGFCKEFAIDPDLFECSTQQSFNDFFIRKFKPGVRTFETKSELLPSPAEGKCLAYANWQDCPYLRVKQRNVQPEEFLPADLQKTFAGGPCLIIRLAPQDYHRFHCPDNAQVLSIDEMGKALHSVNPMTLAYDPSALLKNYRRGFNLHCEHFGKLYLVAVGATLVGKIVSVVSPDENVNRGQELGHFLIGGSTLVIFGEPGRWTPQQELLNQTAQGHETLIKLGSLIGQKLT